MLLKFWLDCRQRGGVEEERAERLRVQQKEQTASRGNFDEMQTMRRECWRKVGHCCHFPCTNPGVQLTRDHCAVFMLSSTSQLAADVVG